MENTYTIELTGKQLCLLMNCIDERINSNNQISSHTGKSKGCENRSLRSLQRYMRNIKNKDKENKSKKNNHGTPY